LSAAEPTERDLAAVRKLWREYWDSLGLPDDFQNFAAELAALPGPYERIFLERAGEEPAGTIAIRPANGAACEMKRLYVRPAFRGRGIGQALLNRAIAEARALGYTEIVADTMPGMTSAREMYRKAGFVESPACSEEPTPCAILLRLAL
jgi:GNAT superfamily N-acetyltransferase